MVNVEKNVPDYIIESSWEVCNKVGGIYTVLSTRAKTLQTLFGDNVIYIGPDIWKDGNNPDFIENKNLLKSWKKQATEKDNLEVRVGRWNIPGKPIVILVDFVPYYGMKNDIYYRMWEKFGVDSMVAYGDYDQSSMFAYATALVIKSLYDFFKMDDKKVVAHLNEWMLGMATLFVQDSIPQVATVFTTHATTIGRSIAGNSKPLYDQFKNYNGDHMARELNVEAKHSVEKKAAHYADCFTTVSELTARECRQLLDKNPDIVTPNGFEFNFVPQGKNFDKKREIARKSLIHVAEELVGEEIAENALLIGISGRYEYKNKGIDLFIESMNRVRLSNPDRQIIAYILVPAWIEGPRTDLQARLRGSDIPKFPLYGPYCTHILNEWENDKVCSYMAHLNFYNQKEYKTKLIFVPSYLNGNDGIFNLPYYDLLIGMDLTIFPSYYEPWGYTPLESIAFCVPTITTNLAGFGLWARQEGATSSDLKAGVEVLERTDYNYFEVSENIKETILNYALDVDEKQTNEARSAAKTLSEKASWTHFINYYLDAYNIALRNAQKRTSKKK